MYNPIYISIGSRPIFFSLFHPSATVKKRKLFCYDRVAPKYLDSLFYSGFIPTLLASSPAMYIFGSHDKNHTVSEGWNRRCGRRDFLALFARSPTGQQQQQRRRRGAFRVDDFKWPHQREKKEKSELLYRRRGFSSLYIMRQITNHSHSNPQTDRLSFFFFFSLLRRASVCL